MRYHAVELEMGPETMSRIGDDWLRRWQETVDDAQETFTKAVSTANPMDALTLQMEFGMRNAQRWFAWGDLESLAGDPEPVGEPNAGSRAHRRGRAAGERASGACGRARSGRTACTARGHAHRPTAGRPPTGRYAARSRGRSPFSGC